MSFPILLLGCALKATLLLAVSALVSLALRSRPAAHRHLAWAALFPALLVLPVAALWVPAVKVAIPKTTAVFLSTVTNAGTSASPEAGNWLAWCFAAGAAISLAPLLIGAWRLHSLLGRAIRLDDAGGVRVYATPEVSVPLTWGLLRPVVLLPAGAETWPADRMDTVLAHELSHIRRLDWLSQTVARVACSLYWFHPLVWLGARRLKSESELACDDDVLSLGIRGTDYARHLVEIARGVNRKKEVVAMAIPMADKSNLERRVLAILDPAVRRARASRGLLAAVAAVVFVVSVPLSTIRADDSKEGQIKEAVKVEGDMTPPALIKKVEPKYPPELKDQKIEDSVRIKIVISKTGKVIDAQPIQTPSHQEFVKAAEEALLQWEFQPARKNGQPVSVIADVEINFRLQ